ncbi:hypothetical protein AMTR_s00006p00179660 [Amborella trichopoda]|uniref:Uncharacterized protein n=1 Tax=Amborella trichopoda TaxID=13333 RepID=W1PDC0_AMBTC|nr:hypothetical protein AMTR_s00006p00179660 [Amborella trichopoda]
MALARTGVRVLKGSHDDPVINSELVPSDLRCLIEILKAKSKAVHKLLKVIRPEPNLVHQKMMTDRGDRCWPVTTFMVAGRMDDLVNFSVQRLGGIPTC